MRLAITAGVCPIRRPVKPQVNNRPGDPKRRCAAAEIMNAEAESVFREQCPHFFVVPGGLTKFEDVRDTVRQLLDEFAEAVEITPPARRKLIQDRPEVGTEIDRAAKKPVQRLRRRLQFFHVGKETACLQSVDKA